MPSPQHQINKILPPLHNAHETNLIYGMGFMTAAVLIIPGIDVFAKLLGPTMSAGQIVFYRFLVQTFLLTPIIIYREKWHIPPNTLMLQLLRGVLLAAATVFFFAALTALSIAEAISIFFVEPLILTILSAIFLGEVIRARRIIAIIVGFTGALIIIEPSFVNVGFAALYPLGAAICFAFYVLLTRKLSHQVEPIQMQWVVGIAASTVLLCGLGIGEAIQIPVFKAGIPHGVEITWVISLGIIATIGHLALVHATRYAPASTLAPLQYLEIIGAVVFGYLVFGDGLSLSTIIGVSIIIASGLYIFYRETRVYGRKAK